MTTFAEQQPTELIASEEELVSKWRLDQFLTLGFSDENACLLAESDVDLNRARSLVAAECPLTVALQILI
jgi:tRNA(His) 5'-end guanylyltransferase